MQDCSSTNSSTPRWLSYLIFPLIMGSVIAAALAFYTPGRAPWLTVPIFLAVLVSAMALETRYPFESAWKRSWRENGQDGIFFLIAQPFIALADITALALGTAALVWAGTVWHIRIWPSEISLLLQIPLALLVAEFLPYVYHRLSHQSGGFLWRIHSIHHVPNRIYSLNFIRFHPINSFTSSFFMLLPLVALGTPAHVVFVVAMLQKTHSVLTHTNFDFRLGWMNWIFSMAELHRWHHVRDINVANHNYGATLIFWDIVFRTRYLPKRDIHGVALGVLDPQSVPSDLCGQVCTFGRGTRRSR